MIIATLYPAEGSPVNFSLDELDLQNAEGGLKPSVERIAIVLGCRPELVDVLASEDSCMAFSIFDYEGDVNSEAMDALAKTTGYRFDVLDDNHVIQGPVLIIRKV